MERKGLALRAMMRKHRPKQEDLDPRSWRKRDIGRGFADFILHQHSDKDEDNSFDNEVMCEYARIRNRKRTRRWLYRT